MNATPSPHAEPEIGPYIAQGFPGSIDRQLADVGVAGIDRDHAQQQVRFCDETEPMLYGGGYSPTRIAYRRGARPTLERIADALPGDSDVARARAAMAWVAREVPHPHVVGPTPPDRDMTEEQLIDSGVAWCNEQARIFIALCGVMAIPARVCFLYHDNLRCGHATAEAFVAGRWAFFDVTFDVAVPLPDGRLAEARELRHPHRDLAHAAYHPVLTRHYRRMLAYVNDTAWSPDNRPHPDRGGDLLAHLGFCNYLIDGVSPA